MKKFYVFSLLIISFFFSKCFATEYFDSGVLLFNAQKYPQAYQYFNYELNINSQNIEARYYLAHCLLYLGKTREALLQYKKIISLAPESQVAQYASVSVSSIEAQLPKNDNYLKIATTQQLETRWQKNVLYVYLPSSSYSNIIKSAFSQWQSALGGKIKFSYVYQPKKADISVELSDDISSKSNSFYSGFTNVQATDGIISSAKINLLIFDTQLKKPLSPSLVLCSALHEIGHALGIQAHSDNKNDIMYPISNSKTLLSSRDKNTIKLLYFY